VHLKSNYIHVVVLQRPHQVVDHCQMHRSCVHIYKHKYTHMCNAHTFKLPYIYMHIYIECIHPLPNAPILCAYINMYIYTHINIYIYIYTYTHIWNAYTIKFHTYIFIYLECIHVFYVRVVVLQRLPQAVDHCQMHRSCMHISTYM